IVPRERLQVTPSCSLLHVPYDAAREETIEPEIRSWLAFAEQKLAEVVTLGPPPDRGHAAVAAELHASGAVTAARRASARVHDAAVQRRVAEGPPSARPPYAERRPAQEARL